MKKNTDLEARLHLINKAKLAKQLGISPQYLCDILKGRSKPKKRIAQINSFLDSFKKSA